MGEAVNRLIRRHIRDETAPELATMGLTLVVGVPAAGADHVMLSACSLDAAGADPRNIEHVIGWAAHILADGGWLATLDPGGRAPAGPPSPVPADRRARRRGARAPGAARRRLARPATPGRDQPRRRDETARAPDRARRPRPIGALVTQHRLRPPLDPEGRRPITMTAVRRTRTVRPPVPAGRPWLP